MYEISFKRESERKMDNKKPEKANVELVAMEDCMEKHCELCARGTIKESFHGVELCEDCFIGIGKALNENNNESMMKYRKEENFPNATARAKKEIIDVFRQEYEKNISRVTENKNSEKKADSEHGVRYQNAEKYQLNYKRIISMEEKREWIEDYMSIKRFIKVVYALVGMLVGYGVAKLFAFEVFETIISILIIGGLGTLIAVNSAGKAVMAAITAEESIITEELLREMLNRQKCEEEE